MGSIKFIYSLLTIALICSCQSKSRNDANAETTKEPESVQLDTLGLANFIANFELDKEGALTFEVPKGKKFAVLHGYIVSTTPETAQKFIDSNPHITTLVFMQIDGSKDDTANLKACQLLKKKEYTYYLPGVKQFDQDAFIASGGVDMFFSGKLRIVESTAEIGVHAWGDGVNEATDFPREDSIHLEYINYYEMIGLSKKQAEDFYFFTINSATHDSIHFMTDEEISLYNLRNN